MPTVIVLPSSWLLLSNTANIRVVNANIRVDLNDISVRMMANNVLFSPHKATSSY